MEVSLRVKGIIWVGTAVDDRRATSDFFVKHLGLKMEDEVSGFSRLVAENGDRLEIFGPDSVEHDQLDTGPVAGFWVDDAREAHREMTDSGVAELTPIRRGRDGHRWFYFRAPDGNFYEICETTSARRPRGE